MEQTIDFQKYVVQHNIKKTSFITVQFQVEGIHCYPEAGTNPELEDVSFLQYPHRHMFHFTVSAEVNHNNRDIEFIQLKRACLELFDQNFIDANNHSCEDLCDMLFVHLDQRYPDRMWEIKCFEDGENGAETMYLRHK